MSAPTPAEIRARLAAYYTAELRVLNGQAVSMGARSLTRADLAEIRAGIKDLQAALLAAERGGKIRQQRVVPRDI